METVIKPKSNNKTALIAVIASTSGALLIAGVSVLVTLLVKKRGKKNALSND